MTAKLRGNQCIQCEKTHEECAVSSCVKKEISRHVLRMFGIRPGSKKSTI